MAKLVLKHDGPLGLPRGPVLRPGVETNVDNWDTLKEHAVVKAWLDAGVLEVVNEDDDDDQDGPVVDPELEDLKVQARELGIKTHHKWSKDKIQEAINAKLAE